jgi:hypothetical protein
VLLDEVYPPCGPCLICGRYDDKRHRLADAIASEVRAGCTMDELISEYDVMEYTPEGILLLAAWGKGGFKKAKKK